jgi:hypothetical protein
MSENKRDYQVGHGKLSPRAPRTLAAAFIAAEQRPASLEMITLDERLASAAQKEGFTVIDIATD